MSREPLTLFANQVRYGPLLLPVLFFERTMLKPSFTHCLKHGQWLPVHHLSLRAALPSCTAKGTLLGLPHSFIIHRNNLRTSSSYAFRSSTFAFTIASESRLQNFERILSVSGDRDLAGNMCASRRKYMALTEDRQYQNHTPFESHVSRMTWVKLKA